MNLIRKNECLCIVSIFGWILMFSWPSITFTTWNIKACVSDCKWTVFILYSIFYFTLHSLLHGFQRWSHVINCPCWHLLSLASFYQMTYTRKHKGGDHVTQFQLIVYIHHCFLFSILLSWSLVRCCLVGNKLTNLEPTPESFHFRYRNTHTHTHTHTRSVQS